MSASHLLGLQGPQQTPASRTSSKLEFLTVCCCCVPTPGGPNLNHKSVCVHTYVPMSDEKVGSLQGLILWEIYWGFDQQSQVDQESEGLLWPKKKLMLRLLESHVKTFRVDIPFSLAVLQSSLLVPNRSELDRVRSQALAHQIKRVVATQASAATKVCFKDIWTWACHWKLFERGVGKCLIEK